MPSSISKMQKNRRSRRLSGQTRPMQNPIPISIVSATKNGAVLTVVFNQTVSLKGVPQYSTDVVGATAQSAAMSSTTTMELTFSATIAAATEVTVPFEDPAIRNASGGYPNAGTFPVA